MSVDHTRERLVGELTEPLLTLGLDLEGIELAAAGRRRVLRVAVDRDGGVTLDDVAAATKEVSRLLDDSDVMGEQPYLLEVSSPGTDRPLTHPRHWRRNAGRLVTVRIGPAGATEELTGRVTAVSESGITLAVESKGKPGAKKRPPTPRDVPWTELGAGRVQVEFGRAAAKPIPDTVVGRREERVDQYPANFAAVGHEETS